MVRVNGSAKGHLLTKDMQTFPLSFDPVFIDDAHAQCTEMIVKLIFLFLFFELPIIKIHRKVR